MASWKIALEINRGLSGLATMILIVGIDLRIFFFCSDDLCLPCRSQRGS